MEFPARLNPPIRGHFVLPVAEEPVGPLPILALVHLGVLDSPVQGDASRQRQQGTFIPCHKQGFQSHEGFPLWRLPESTATTATTATSSSLWRLSRRLPFTYSVCGTARTA